MAVAGQAASISSALVRTRPGNFANSPRSNAALWPMGTSSPSRQSVPLCGSSENGPTATRSSSMARNISVLRKFSASFRRRFNTPNRSAARLSRRRRQAFLSPSERETRRWTLGFSAHTCWPLAKTGQTPAGERRKQTRTPTIVAMRRRTGEPLTAGRRIRRFSMAMLALGALSLWAGIAGAAGARADARQHRRRGRAEAGEACHYRR